MRATVLAVAADRGVPTKGADADDSELVERQCTHDGVRHHYRDWPYKRESEHAFRTRQADILVATSTQVGMDRVEVSMVQQMLGRERQGWAWLLTSRTERPHGQARLAAGCTVLPHPRPPPLPCPGRSGATVARLLGCSAARLYGDGRGQGVQAASGARRRGRGVPGDRHG
ncbi:hypothetical protein PUR57_13545 [Streptomyces sp. JV176]|uniref:hypothetical protein n=1 Tax=Streptomyces sp. JV176 TaxID=858630 RepID=UPI002E7A8E32|nr:hypothetical protein [Streptomyces sp. JV176]MEE1799683.1 hypothetical protein [Streptomyces sp. JV176]